jgi:hypothetical protein
MGDLGYNTGVNHIKSSKVLQAPCYPFSTDVKGIDTMSHSIPNPSVAETKRVQRNAEYRARITNDPEYRKKRNDKSRRWRERNRARIAEYNAARYEEKPEYLYQATRSYIQRNPERRSAHKAVSYAVKVGKFPPAWTMVCEHCQEALASQYHHHNGYLGEHRLDVIALCTECHGKAHWV